MPSPVRPDEPAPGDSHLKVIRDLVRRNAAVAVAIPRHHPIDGAHQLACAEPAVSVQVEDAEDRAALVGCRHDQARPRGLASGDRRSRAALSDRSCRRHPGR